MDDPDYTKTVIEGNSDEGTDIHTVNQHLAGLDTRAKAKTFIYAFLYGAGDAKIGKIVGGTGREGRKLKEKFLTNLSKLDILIKKVRWQGHHVGHVQGLDGRRIWTRSPHAALNTLLQGGGAIVCKLWTIYIHQLAKEAGIEFYQVATIHDEYQFEVKEEQAVEFGEITREAIKMTEKTLKMKVPLDSEYKVGVRWSETHKERS